jgi:hypothetical protein
MNKYWRFPTICHVRPGHAAHLGRNYAVSPGCRLLRRLNVAIFTALAFGCLAVAASIARAATLEDEHPPDAIEVFRCNFDESWDVNYDLWPDRWVRQTGPDYPHYVDMQIRDDDDRKASGGRCLEIDLNGASAAVSSPPIRVISRFSYLLMTRIKLTDVNRSDVTLTIDFYNAAGKLLQTQNAELTSRTDGWHQIKITSIDPKDPSIDRAIISLVARRGSKGDLKGKVNLGDMWLARLPRISVSTNCAYNVYSDPKDVVVNCELSGIRERDPEIRFQLMDASSKELHGGSVHLDGRLIVEDTKKASDIVDGIGNTPAGYEGSTQWRPTIPGYGFYSVNVKMLSSDASGKHTDDEREMDSRVIWLAVVPPLPMPTQGDFGWSLPEGDHPLSFQELTQLLPMVGINWLKVPAWYNASDTARGDDIIRFVEMLGASNIEVVGVIDRPPAGSELAQRMGRDISIADLLTMDPAFWVPSLDPVMSRVSMRLRWWQLGQDSDTSLAGFPNLNQRISEFRQRLFRFGQEVKLGLAWAWDSGKHSTEDTAWDFEQLAPDPALTTQKFEDFVAQPVHDGAQHWVTIEPPSRPADISQITPAELDARAAQFVRKIIAAKEHGADGIFISKPFDDRAGLMRANGMPAELLLPWRAAASMLGGTKYLGTIQLPNGSDNRIFIRSDGQAMMVVWNDKPTQETLYLGKEVHVVDLWGRSKSPSQQDNQQVIDVGPLPTFVSGLSEPIARWRMALRFDQDHIDSIFEKPQKNKIDFQNCFGQGAGGTISIVAPQTGGAADRDTEKDALKSRGLETDPWSIEPPRGTFSLAAGESFHFPFEVRLKNAIFGKQPMRIDFDVSADEQYKFSVYSAVWVGAGDVTIDVKTHLDKDGTLVVQQIMANKSDRLVDFKCNLFAKGFRPQRAQVYRLGATPDRKLYRYPKGADLLGKTLLLEAEEIGGLRVFKFSFVAMDTKEADDAKANQVTKGDGSEPPARSDDAKHNADEPRANDASDPAKRVGDEAPKSISSEDAATRILPAKAS